MSVIIRDAQPKDVAQLAKIHVESWRTTYAGIVPDDVLANLSYAQREEQWRRTLAALGYGKTSFAFVTEQEGNVVGFSSVGPEREGDETYRAELYAIYLLQAYQGRGIGRALFRQAAEQLMQWGHTAMLLWVLAENPGRGFYETQGGVYLRAKTITVGVPLQEVAYGWPNLPALLGPAE